MCRSKDIEYAVIQLHKIQHCHDRVTFINGDEKLASDGLVSPAGNTRTCQKVIERQLSPIMIKYRERSKSFIHFITGCFAIIGGLFTIAGMLDTFVFRYRNILKKQQMNKLT
ncbi:endoplasmic reticulum-Golgi intermediate compartment 3 [Brachionus plicatilis]|uniref:Endoplasmic reticulum-Golgi intermediate compartment protein 3 n=1 Tax=Brachionus plicatilis TaxID=10195 RepID=A0A3M7RSF6_BRAPC|nr:endoplasmic reticulum-Golgi intermediate compartment 3 [Brachionus plicatilis]